MAHAIMAGATLRSAVIVRAMAEMPPTLEARGIVGPHEFPLLHPDRHRWGAGSHLGAAVQYDSDSDSCAARRSMGTPAHSESQ